MNIPAFKKALLAVTAVHLVSAPAVIAQAQYPLEWAASPAIHALTADQKKYSAVVLLDQRRLEYKQNADKDYYVYRSVHRIVRIVDDKGLESFNKYTIPVGDDRKLTTIKARTISAGGKVTEVKETDIKTVKAEDGTKQYLFAMSGAEKGAEVEVLYTERRPFAVFSSETFQSVIPVVKADFSMIVPDNLAFETAGYNGFPKAVDSTVDKQHYYFAQSSNLAALEDEEYSNMDANKQRIDFKLSYIIGEHSGVRRFTWTDLAKDLYEKYEKFTGKESKEVDQYLEAIGVTKEDSELEKIRKIENKMKRTISISEELPDDEIYEDFDQIIAKKLTNEKGFARLMAACFTRAGIVHEFGLSNSRYDHMIDERIEIWTALREFVIYFPEQKMYLAPTAIAYRAPYIPHGLMGNKGIFCKLSKIDRAITPVADVRTIPPLPMDQSGSGVDADISFSEDNLVPRVALTHLFYGYPAIGLRAAFQVIEKDKEKEAVLELAGIGSKADDMKDYKVENTSYKSYYTNTPLKLSVNVDAPQLMEKAGPKYLFKVGSVIGRQTEMYKDEVRKLPIDVNYRHSLPRNIRITIPAGYKVLNPESVRIHVTDKSNGSEATMGFVSDYKMNGNVMEITINEFYNQLNYPVSDYPTFRKVINAAADFNKVVLVLQKS